MKIQCFGITRDICGGSEVTINVPLPINIEEFKAALESLYPDLKRLKSLRIAVDGGYSEDSMEITTNSEVVLIPPVSGG